MVREEPLYITIIEALDNKKNGFFDFHIYMTLEEAQSLAKELRREFPSAYVTVLSWAIEDTNARDWLMDYYKNNHAYGKMRFHRFIPHSAL